MKGGVGYGSLLGHFTLKPVNVIGTGTGVGSSDSFLSLGAGFCGRESTEKNPLGRLGSKTLGQGTGEWPKWPCRRE